MSILSVSIIVRQMDRVRLFQILTCNLVCSGAFCRRAIQSAGTKVAARAQPGLLSVPWLAGESLHC